MSHLDEGQLHALLDGELTGPERSGAESHLATCAECRRAYGEAKALLEEADAFIASVDLPAQASPVHAPAPGSRGSGLRWRNLAWAATVVLAVGLGWLARSSQMKQIIGGAEVRADLARKSDSAPTARSAGPTPPAQEPSPRPADGATQRSAEPTLKAESAPEEQSPPAAAAQNRGERPAAAPPASPVTAPGPALEAKPSAASASAPSPMPAKEALDAVTGGVDRERAEALADAAGVAPERRDAGHADGRRQAAQPTSSSLRRDRIVLGLNGPLAGREAGNALRPIPLEQAVRILGGSIRLVDGLSPTRVLAGVVPVGAGPATQLVRVVYDDPPGRELWLDQHRPVGSTNEAVATGQGSVALLPGDTVAVNLGDGARSLLWIDQSGFQLGLTGFLQTDSLRALARRVQ